MVKIKTKKRMSPEEYAKYMIDKHGISGLESELIDDNIIDAPKRHTLTFELNPVSMEEMSDTGFENKEFTIEVEEDITEDTKLSKSLAIFEHNGNLYSEMHNNKNINDILKMDIKVKSSSTKTIHMVNDDGTHTLIWTHEKGLVE